MQLTSQLQQRAHEYDKGQEMKQLFLMITVLVVFANPAIDTCDINISENSSNMTPVYLFEDVTCAKCHKHLNDESEGYVFEYDEHCHISYLCNDCADKLAIKYENMKEEFFKG